MDFFITDYRISGADAVALEDSIMQQDKLVTAGSKMLRNYTSLISATVVTRLLDGEYKIAGKTKMDEFGIDNILSDSPDILSAAVKVVADDVAAYSLCNDVFGKYRRQAAQNGCCYIRPTYGTVSRYGLIPLVSSMDQIGIVCKNLHDGLLLLKYIAGNDINDGAMFPEKKYNYDKINSKITVGVPDAVVSRADKDTQGAIKSFAEKFNSVSINLEHFDIYKQVMYILSSAEISNNINRYDGIKFGYRASGYRGIDGLYTKSRTEGFGLNTKLTAIIGTIVLSQDYYTSYYEQAMKIRRLVKESLRFSDYDIIALPCAISGSKYDNLSLYALAALAGLPSISFPYKGQGIQLVANVKNESIFKAVWEACMS